MREGVSEGSRHGSRWVTFSSISHRYSSRIMYLLECAWLSLHVHLGGEIITTGHCSPCRGNIIVGTGSVREDGAH